MFTGTGLELEFLGAGREVGRSGILLRTGTENILMDYGIKVGDENVEYPEMVIGKLNALLLSHAHLDHVGNVPALFAEGKRFTIYSPKINKYLSELLWEDTMKIARFERKRCAFNKGHTKKALKNFQAVNYKKQFMIGNSRITGFDAGHIPGSTMFMVETNKKKILYTGDFNWRDTKLINGCEKNLPDVDILITESTYFKSEHPPREHEEKRLVQAVKETLDNNGVALISAFAVSRAQEMILILDEFGIDAPIYLDGMARDVAKIFNRFPDLLREFDSLNNAMTNRNVEFVNRNSDRKKIIQKPGVIISPSGMLSGGPIAYYIEQLHKCEECSLLLTGFQVPMTEGHRLLETGRYIHDDLDLRLKMRVEKLEFSGHADNSEILDLIKRTKPEEVFCVHGEHTEEFAKFLNEHDIYAKAPFNGEMVEI
jgi:putative mRNA 3-end processing factor